jgi:hypothetical protein
MNNSLVPRYKLTAKNMKEKSYSTKSIHYKMGVNEIAVEIAI